MSQPQNRYVLPSFVERKHGREEFEYPDPRTRTMLEETYGIMVYQEQVMQMAQIVGGYSLGGADLLRRAMGKKVPAEMAKHREIFREGAARGGVGERKADEIFDLMEKFAGYGFNKSHAAAYSLVAYQTAWLKKHYPAEFMAATLSSDMDKTDKVVGFLDEARGLGLDVLPPDVNHSDFMFVATDAKTVRYGLGAAQFLQDGADEFAAIAVGAGLQAEALGGAAAPLDGGGYQGCGLVGRAELTACVDHGSVWGHQREAAYVSGRRHRGGALQEQRATAASGAWHQHVDLGAACGQAIPTARFGAGYCGAWACAG